MSRNASIFVIVVIVALGAGGIYWYLSSDTGTYTPASTSINETGEIRNSETPPVTQSETSTQGGSTVPKEVTVTYTDSGYSPKSITVQAGTKVTFVNNSSGAMWTASDPHPVHTTYPVSGGCIKSAFDECKADQPGSSWSFTFDKVGTWGYHNHRSPTTKGTVIVE